MAITIVGIIWAYMTIIMLIAQPTNIACILSSYSFHVSITLIYAPVLVKSNRVYRIFSIKKTGHLRVHWISKKSQMVLVLMAILLMVSINDRLQRVEDRSVNHIVHELTLWHVLRYPAMHNKWKFGCNVQKLPHFWPQHATIRKISAAACSN